MAVERVDGFVDRLDGFLADKGIGHLTKHDNDYYLDLLPAQITAMEMSEAYEVAMSLARFAGYVQEQVNIQQMKAGKARFEINRIVYPRLDQYTLFKTEDKIMQATLDDETASALLEIEHNCLAVVTRLQYLAQSIMNQAHKIESYVKSKNNGTY